MSLNNLNLITVTFTNYIAEQWRVENCLSSCQQLLAQICDWYCKERDIERLQAFYAISTLIREFADFPLYDLGAEEMKSMLLFINSHLLNFLTFFTKSKVYCHPFPLIVSKQNVYWFIL